ncbi:hypothetical protein HY492_01410 [Candidatus Woesearchaeota archaeon]|nr:hypothetical protein [Candidatus Woesearchaeota archaeon]
MGDRASLGTIAFDLKSAGIETTLDNELNGVLINLHFISDGLPYSVVFKNPDDYHRMRDYYKARQDRDTPTDQGTPVYFEKMGWTFSTLLPHRAPQSRRKT